MLILEEGQAGADSESYCSVDFATDYHTKRGNVAWLHLPTVLDKERALRRATDFMVGEYRAAWKGCRVKATQRLDWPRYDVEVDGFCLPSDEVPLPVKEACAELALRAITASLAPDEGPQKSEVKVGPILVKYEEGARAARKFTAVDSLLGPYLSSGGSGNSIAVVRC